MIYFYIALAVLVLVCIVEYSIGSRIRSSMIRDLEQKQSKLSEKERQLSEKEKSLSKIEKETSLSKQALSIRERILASDQRMLASRESYVKRLESEYYQHEDSLKAQQIELEKTVSTLQARKDYLERIISRTSIIHPWAAEEYADLLHAADMADAAELRSRYPPAYTAAAKVSEISKELRSYRKLAKEFQYRLRIYESAVPWLRDYSDLSANELIELSTIPEDKEKNESDYLSRWLSPDEYNKLPNDEKYQLALDRWKQRKKSNWEAGRDFERFVGYQYEIAGYSVAYTGALTGLNDLGRDLIAEKDSTVLIIQCKRWNEQRTIHEKHVFQLYGSVISYSIENPLFNVRGILVTTCPISETAQKYAEYLDITLDSSYKSDQVFDYPMIKCNVGNHGEKIYHLPFDQQYDRVVITPSKGEFFAWTVKEAEDKGFRRAFRWSNPNQS
jgi:hypothetical protein